MNNVELVFWVCVGIIFYTFIGYALIVWVLVKLKGLLAQTKIFNYAFEPEVSLIIPCYNESVVLPEKLKNSFELDYPKHKLHIIFVTDGSDDGSNELLKNVKGITVLHEDIRAGKSVAENRAMQHIRTPFVVFSDANTRLNKSAIREIMKHYQDESVGAVSGEKRIISKSQDSAPAAGEGFYWRYESHLKKLDSQLYSVVGGAGELISFRTELFSPLEEDTILDDFVQTIRITLKGYRVVYEPKAFAEETASATVREELKRKVRISAGAWQAMSRLGKAFNPFNNLALAFSFVSHKVFRWTFAPLALIVLVPINYYLHTTIHGVYSILWLTQGFFYLFTLFGWYFENKKIHVKIIFIPYYFFMTNWCMYLGFFRFITGSQSAKWERAERGI